MRIVKVSLQTEKLYISSHVRKTKRQKKSIKRKCFMNSIETLLEDNKKRALPLGTMICSQPVARLT